MSTTQDAKEETLIPLFFIILFAFVFFGSVNLSSKKTLENKKQAYQTKIQELNNRIKQIEFQKQKLVQALQALEKQK